MVYTALKNAGVPLDDLNAALGAEFPAATTAVTTAVDTNIVGAQEKISSSIKTAQTDVEEATAGIKSSTEENFAGVNDSTVLNWGNSAKEVKTNVRAMKIQANLSLGEMTKGVKSQFQSQYNIMTRKWKNASDEINRTVGGMSGSIDKSLSSLVGKVCSLLCIGTDCPCIFKRLAFFHCDGSYIHYDTVCAWHHDWCMADLLDFRQRVYRRYGAYAHHRKNRHPHVCDFSLFPYNQRRISGDPGCHENAGYPLRWETSFADGGIQAGSFDGIRCKDW